MRSTINNQPSLTVPSDEVTYYLAARAPSGGEHENALRLVLRYLETRRLINPTLAIFNYDSSTGHGEGLTVSRGREDPAAGYVRGALRGLGGQIHDLRLAFTSVPLFSTIT